MIFRCLLIVPFLLGMGRFFGNPLDGKSVISFYNPVAEGYSAEVRVRSDTWTPLPFIAAGDCIAFTRGLAFGWRACLTKCTEFVSGPITEPCARIFRPNGTMYKAEDVVKWNSEHVGD